MKMTTTNSDIIRNSDIIIVAVKPHQVLDIMADIQAVYSEVQSSGVAGSQTITAPRNLRPLIVSVAAAITISDIEQKVHE